MIGCEINFGNIMSICIVVVVISGLVEVLIMFICCLVVRSWFMVFLVIIGRWRKIRVNLFLSLIEFVEV